MLLIHIHDDWAGRYRRIDGKEAEWVKIGGQFAADPAMVPEMMRSLFRSWQESEESVISRVARFHLVFETIHPFCDGNGRIGRVALNYQLESLGYPPIIIQNKEKKYYYEAFRNYQNNRNIESMERIILMTLIESLHKRIAYLHGDEIIWLDTCARGDKKRYTVLMNGAKRQSLPAFRERGKWKIGKKMFEAWEKGVE